MTQKVSITINGPPAPTDATSVCDDLRRRYERALLLVLAAESGGSLENVRTIVVYGTRRLNAGPSQAIRSPGDGRGRPPAMLYRSMLSADEATNYVQGAKTGRVFLPSSPHEVLYRLESWWEGFLPRSERNGVSGPSSTTSIWRRRRQSQKPRVLGVEVGPETLLSIMDRLPAMDEVDWALLNPRKDPSSLDSLDELYPSPVRLHIRHAGTRQDATVEDPEGWLTSGVPASIRVEGNRFGLRQRTCNVPVTGAGTYAVPLHEPAMEAVLELDGVPLDAFDGTFVGIVQSVEPISGGNLPNVYALADLTKRYSSISSSVRDIVIDPRAWDEAKTAAEVQRIVASSCSNGEPARVDIFDPYAVPGRTLEMLSVRLPAGSSIRIACNQVTSDGDFPGVLTKSGIKIERYGIVVGLPAHDRFLRIGGTIWAMGVSLNQVGKVFSVFVEIRDLSVMSAISSMLDSCFVGAAQATS